MLAACSRPDRAATLTGYIEPAVLPVATVTGGKVSEVLAHPGDRVQQGQTLVRFDSQDLHDHVAQLRHAIAAYAPAQAAAAASLIARVPPATWTSLIMTDPARLAVELQYTDALQEADRHPSPRSRDLLKQADARRAQMYRDSLDPQIHRLTAALRSIASSAETLPWLSAQLDRFEVRAPIDGRVEILDLAPGALVAPFSAVVLLELPGRFLVKANCPTPVAPGASIQVMIANHRATAAIITKWEDNRLEALIAHPNFMSLPVQPVLIRLQP